MVIMALNKKPNIAYDFDTHGRNALMDVDPLIETDSNKVVARELLDR
ncbi:hypothetical protein GCM10007879_10610 [Maritalea porphyrae]|uniref:Uncharacterized protein n=1 Tax=Maritalea porphyrae TaxID=880732 RepID=A0ABQ5UNS8_9HYPH|nr:hypothetical protein GCM10007879_10610 [Maritalea porphyrae]